MECTFEEMVHSLSGLKAHKSLSTLKCSLESVYMERIAELSTLQAALGEHIKVTEIPLFSFYVWIITSVVGGYNFIYEICLY